MILALLASPTLTGCFAFERIDSGLSEMEERAAKRKKNKNASENLHAKHPPPEAAPAATKPGGAQAMIAEVQASVREWWGSARSITPGEESDSGLVACQLNGQTAWMLEHECAARGGTAGS